MKLLPLASALALALLVSACGKSEAPAPAADATPAAEAPTAAPAETAPASDAATAATDAAASGDDVGKKVFGATCALCHASGLAGAPKPGDKADWGPRIAQGKDTMYKHAIEGFTGAKGMMPAKGGSANLTDAEVKAAVDYMADKSL